MKRNEGLLAEAINLGPLVAAAKDAADTSHRPGDWAIFIAVENFLQASAEFFGEDDAGPGAVEVAAPAAAAAEKGDAAKHRHKFDDAGNCTVVAGCGAKPRKKAEAPASPAAPTPPAGGSTS